MAILSKPGIKAQPPDHRLPAGRIGDLVRLGRIRINSPSLYAEFGDKRGLYFETIDSYANDDGCAPLVALETEPDISKAVRAFFEAVVTYATHHESGATGCFLVSCVSTSAGNVSGTQELLRDAIETTDARITARFDLEKTRRTLPADFPSIERAKLLFDLRARFKTS